MTHRRRQNFYALPTAHWQMLAAPPLNILSNLDLVDDAIDANGEIASQILETALISFGIADGNPDSTSSSTVWHGVAAPGDLE